MISNTGMAVGEYKRRRERMEGMEGVDGHFILRQNLHIQHQEESRSAV
jgi:hypothetical protein